MHRWAATTILGCTLAGTATLPSRAEPLQDSRGTYTFQIENDAVSTQKGTSDQYYTNGLRLGYTSPTGAVPDVLARAGHAIWGDGVQRISIDLSQSIFTPRDTQISPPNPRDRPYAGYLNLTGALIQDTDTSRSTLAVSLGIIGPSALGRQVQNGYHDIVGDTENRGWHNQLQNEPAVQILSERVWRLPLRQFGRFETDALPSATVGVGTVRDYVQGGVSFRFGQGLGSDFGTPRIRPGISGSDAYAQTLPFAWYVFAGADGQAIARDVFLDGSTFRDNSPHVSKKWYLGEFEAGVGIIYRGVRIAYTHTWQTESFNGQKGGLFNFGSLAVSAKF